MTDKKEESDTWNLLTCVAARLWFCSNVGAKLDMKLKSSYSDSMPIVLLSWV